MSYDPRKHGAACGSCPLNTKTVVPPEGPTDATLAIIGEAPGWNEEQTGHPFVGPSGQLLNRLFTHQGIDREHVFVTNAILCRAPELRVGSEVSTDQASLKKAVACCRPRLLRELKRLKPTLRSVVPLGATAVRSLTNRKNLSILAARGFVWETEATGDASVVPSVHPAFVLRAPAWEAVLVSDFDRAARASRGRLGLPQATSHLAPDPRLLRGLLDKLGPTVAVDVETTKLGATSCALLCIGVSDGASAVVIPWASTQSPRRRFYGSKQSAVMDILRRWLSKRTVVTHNGPGFDHVVLARYGLELSESASWEDTLLAHHAYASHMPQRLDHVVSMYLDAPPWKILSRKPAKSDERGAWDPGKLRDEELWSYNAMDAVLTARLWKMPTMRKDLHPEKKVYEEDKRLGLLCRGMQERGVAVDQRRREEVRRELLGRQNYYLGALRQQAGFEIQPTKLDHLRKVLFKVLHGPVLFRSIQTGLPSTSVDTLQALAQTQTAAGKFSRLLLKWREAWKLRSTYVDGIHPERDGRVHPSWRAWGTVSGRLSCREPNLQNLKRGSIIRSMYVAPRGRDLVAFDFKQLEMKIAAYSSGDKNFIAACESEDLHRENALVLFGELPDKDEQPEEYKRLRTIAKSAGFAVNYLATAETVHARLAADGMGVSFMGVSLQQVEAMLQRLKRTYSRYFEWQEEQLRLVQQQGYLRLPLSGRIRWFGHEPMPTEVANYPIQGGAADLMNMFLPEIEDALPRGAFITAQIHDAAIIECAPAQADRIAKLCQKVTERPVDIGGTRAVFPIDVKCGAKRWSEAA